MPMISKMPTAKTVLTYWQAIDRARVLARGEDDKAGDGERPKTVAEALAGYEVDLKARSGDVSTVARVRLHLPNKLSAKPVVLVTADHLKQWRNGLRSDARCRIDRSHCQRIARCLNMVADSDKRVSRHAWEVGLRASAVAQWRATSFCRPIKSIALSARPMTSVLNSGCWSRLRQRQARASVN